MEHKNDGDTNCNWWGRKNPQRLREEEFIIGGRAKTIQTTKTKVGQNTVETCCHLDSSERPFGNTDAKNSPGNNNDNNNNNEKVKRINDQVKVKTFASVRSLKLILNELA